MEYVGAKPVFCDIALSSFNIDPDKIAACLTPRTKAIIPVHFAGWPAPMIALRALADRHGLRIVQDAAHQDMDLLPGSQNLACPAYRLR